MAAHRLLHFMSLQCFPSVKSSLGMPAVSASHLHIAFDQGGHHCPGIHLVPAQVALAALRWQWRNASPLHSRGHLEIRLC